MKLLVLTIILSFHLADVRTSTQHTVQCPVCTSGECSSEVECRHQCKIERHSHGHFSSTCHSGSCSNSSRVTCCSTPECVEITVINYSGIPQSTHGVECPLPYGAPDSDDDDGGDDDGDGNSLGHRLTYKSSLVYTEHCPSGYCVLSVRGGELFGTCKSSHSSCVTEGHSHNKQCCTSQNCIQTFAEKNNFKLFHTTTKSTSTTTPRPTTKAPLSHYTAGPFQCLVCNDYLTSDCNVHVNCTGVCLIRLTNDRLQTRCKTPGQCAAQKVADNMFHASISTSCCSDDTCKNNAMISALRHVAANSQIKSTATTKLTTPRLFSTSTSPKLSTVKRETKTTTSSGISTTTNQETKQPTVGGVQPSSNSNQPIACHECEDYIAGHCGYPVMCSDTCMIRIHDGKINSKCLQPALCEAQKYTDDLFGGSVKTKCCSDTNCTHDTLVYGMKYIANQTTISTTTGSPTAITKIVTTTHTPTSDLSTTSTEVPKTTTTLQPTAASSSGITFGFTPPVDCRDDDPHGYCMTHTDQICKATDHFGLHFAYKVCPETCGLCYDNGECPTCKDETNIANCMNTITKCSSNQQGCYMSMTVSGITAGCANASLSQKCDHPNHFLCHLHPIPFMYSPQLTCNYCCNDSNASCFHDLAKQYLYDRPSTTAGTSSKVPLYTDFILFAHLNNVSTNKFSLKSSQQSSTQSSRTSPALPGWSTSQRTTTKTTLSSSRDSEIGILIGK